MTSLEPPVAAVLRGQLGRPPRAVAGVAVWCPYGFPAVIETYPYLADGTPFPTTLYLSCPSAVDAAGRLESRGGVRDLRRQLGGDATLGEAFAALEAAYQDRRRRLLAEQQQQASAPEPRDGGAVLRAGIGGPSPPERITCLHAVLAALLAAGAEPVSSGVPRREWTALAAYAAIFGDPWCTDVRCAAFLEDRGRVAAIDVGTNSVRLLVAEAVEERALPASPRGPEVRRVPAPTPFRDVIRRARVTRLGAGLVRGGTLDTEARRRTEAAVGEYVREARRLGAVRILLAATSAAREARDGAAFVAALGTRFGVETAVLSGEDEAVLSYAGVALDVPGSPLLVDLGGGSTEVVWRRGQETAAVSLPLGSVRATERWVHHDPPTADERRAVRDEARVQAARLVPPGSKEGAGREPSEPLVAVAGTATTLACVALGLNAYDPAAIHLLPLSVGRLAAEVDRLAEMTERERASLGCMQPGRAGIIVAGGEILLGLLEGLGRDALTVSERDILDGLVLLAMEDGALETMGSSAAIRED